MPRCVPTTARPTPSDGKHDPLEHAHLRPGPGRAPTPPHPAAPPARGAPGRAAAGDGPPPGESEGRARVFVDRAITALAHLGLGTPA